MPDFADQLIAEMTDAPWPLPREVEPRRKVARRRALRSGDKETLKAMAGWSKFTVQGVERDYLVAPLPKMICRTFADFLYGEPPTITPESDEDAAAVEMLDAENDLAAGFKRCVRTFVSEGETFWKILVNAAVAEAPMIDWCSRMQTVPLFYGSRLVAVAFVSEVARYAQSEGTEDDVAPGTIVERHAEVHADGVVIHKLFRGRDDLIGSEIDLASNTATADLPDEWRHDLPMLAGRVVNDIDEDPCLGESDFDQVEDLLLALNEALTISSENARLTGKDRVFAAGRFLQEDGSFDTSLDIFRLESEGGELGEDGAKPPIVAIEKKYDAVALWTHFAKLKAEALAGVGIVVQLTGEDLDTGSAESGAAIRLRYLPTVNASEGKAREVDKAVPIILDRMLQVGALPESQGEMPGGFGWTYSGTPPTVERADVLPIDETEIVSRNVAAVTGEIRSRFIAVKEQHPDWTDDQVKDEIGRIVADIAASMPAGLDAPVDPHDPPDPQQ